MRSEIKRVNICILSLSNNLSILHQKLSGCRFWENVGKMAFSHERICPIHFDGKEDGELKKFTEGTLGKVRNVTRQWLILPEPYKNFTKAAKDSFKTIGDNLELEKVNEACGYHLQCYWSFTDISKLERAKTTIANSGIKRPAEENSKKLMKQVINFKPRFPVQNVIRLKKEQLQERHPPTFYHTFA